MIERSGLAVIETRVSVGEETRRHDGEAITICQQQQQQQQGVGGLRDESDRPAIRKRRLS